MCVGKKQCVCLRGVNTVCVISIEQLQMCPFAIMGNLGQVYE